MRLEQAAELLGYMISDRANAQLGGPVLSTMGEGRTWPGSPPTEVVWIMKKTLLVTTALAGASLLASPASAIDLAAEFQDGASPVVQRQPAFAVRLAGFVRVEANFIDQDNKAMKPSGRLREEVGLAVIGTATADNGLSYGFTYDVDRNRGNLHLANRFGRITMGNTFTATDSLDVGGSSVLVGRGHYFGGGQTLARIPAGGGGAVSLTRPMGIGGMPMRFPGGSTIRYSTPNYGGLTIAVSFTSETTLDKDGSDTDGDAGEAGYDGFNNLMKGMPLTDRWHSEDVWSIGAQYTSSYGNYTTVVYAGYEAGNRAFKDNADYGQHDGHHDVELISFGAKVTGMGAGFGIGYGERQADTNFLGGIADQDVVWYDIAASFSSGPWAVSGGYLHVEQDAGLTGPRNEFDIFSLTTNYRLAPGLSLAGGVSFGDADMQNAALDNEYTNITLATTMNF